MSLVRWIGKAVFDGECEATGPRKPSSGLNKKKPEIYAQCTITKILSTHNVHKSSFSLLL